MATQVMGQSSGGGGLFTGTGNIGMALPNDMYDLHDLSKAELAAPQLIMLANVALTGEVNGSCCDYLVGEERQMAELMPVGVNNFSDSDGEGLEESPEIKGEPSGLGSVELQTLELSVVEPQPVFETSAAPEVYNASKEVPPETPGAEDKGKNLKTKPFRCKPCQYEAESEEQFVHHIRVHSAKKFFVEESAEKQAKSRESGAAATVEEGDFSKGPIRCDRCGYNTNRYDHYTAHLKHHTRAGDNERVYKCIICTYTTVSEYHWRKHLRNHFPRKVYTCGKCNYFSDRKNNYVQHVRTHTEERPYKCELCHYSSSQKTHLTRHMRTHSGEKPFKCDQCSYVASNQHEVTRHARQVHNGPKPLNCPHCDYKTADRSNFKKHVELHVNPRQFNCPVCDYAASKKCNLQYHFKSKHPTCPNKTMDVSKVKLKKTKKREADLPGNNNSNSSEKPELEPSKIKGDVAGKKNEKSVKVEKKDLAKEKKASSNASSQVTTRTRKSALETKGTAPHPGSHSEKSGKAKKNKRKAEAEPPHSPKESVAPEEPAAKKKKKAKAESKSKTSQDVPKAASKVEETKKQNGCLKRSSKKKTLRSKASRKGSKSAPKGPVQKEMPPPDKEPALKESPLRTKPSSSPLSSRPSTPTPTSPTRPQLPTEPLTQPGPDPPPPSLPAPTPMDVVSEASTEEEPPPTAPVSKESREENTKGKLNEQSKMTQKEQVLIEVGLVPVKESTGTGTLDVPSPVKEVEAVAEAETEVQSDSDASGDLKSHPQGQGSAEPLEPPVEDTEALEEALEAETSEPRLAAEFPGALPESTPILPPEQDSNMPECEIRDEKPGAATEPCDMEVDVEEGQAQDLPGDSNGDGDGDGDSAAIFTTTAPAPESISPPPLSPGPEEEGEAGAQAAVAPLPASTASSESQEMDEDEGIHSHDGSDLSDNMSEGSDDSGLNGARSAPKDTTKKNVKDASAGKAAQGDFVCIFCDRSFRKEKDYSKHLNRHLVNVYFLEKAAKGQE